MRGTLELKEHGEWVVLYSEYDFTGMPCVGDIQLHPDDVNWINDQKHVFDNIEARIKSDPIVDFEIVEHQKLSGVVKYAKLTK